MPPDGGGKGHFTTMAEIRATLDDHERRLLLAERDIVDLTDLVAKPKARRKGNRRRSRTTKGE